VTSALAALLAGILRQDKLPPWLNQSISGAFLLLATCIALLASGHLTGDFTIDLGFIGGQMALISLLCAPLVAILQVKVNPGPIPPPEPVPQPQPQFKTPTLFSGSRITTAYLPTVSKEPQPIRLPEVPNTTLPPSDTGGDAHA
jgi:hypothetical protein